MQAVFDIILPVFGLIALGYFAARTGWVKDGAVDGLTRIVFDVAIPMLLFRTMVKIEMPEVSPWGLWGAYFAGCAATWAIAIFVSRRILGQPGDVAAVIGFGSSYANTVLIGIPLVLMVYGDAGAPPLVMIISVHLPVMTFIATMLVSAAQGTSVSVVQLARETLMSLVRQPLIIGLLAGVAYRQTGLAVPGAVEDIIGRIADGAIPFALFAMGLSIKRYGFAGDLPAAGLVTVLKLVFHPLAVWFLASQVFGLPPAWTGVATVFAATPPGINAYLFAVRYDVAAPAVSSAVALGTAIAVVTVSLVLYLLATQAV